MVGCWLTGRDLNEKPERGRETAAVFDEVGDEDDEDEDDEKGEDEVEEDTEKERNHCW